MRGRALLPKLRPRVAGLGESRALHQQRVCAHVSEATLLIAAADCSTDLLPLVGRLLPAVWSGGRIVDVCRHGATQLCAREVCRWIECTQFDAGHRPGRWGWAMPPAGDSRGGRRAWPSTGLGCLLWPQIAGSAMQGIGHRALRPCLITWPARARCEAAPQFPPGIATAHAAHSL